MVINGHRGVVMLVDNTTTAQDHYLILSLESVRIRIHPGNYLLLWILIIVTGTELHGCSTDRTQDHGLIQAFLFFPITVEKIKAAKGIEKGWILVTHTHQLSIKMITLITTNTF